MKPDLRGSEDFLAGLLFLAIGAGAMVVAREYPFGTAMRMGSGELGRVTWGWGPLACIAASMVVFVFFPAAAWAGAHGGDDGVRPAR